MGTAVSVKTLWSWIEMMAVAAIHIFLSQAYMHMPLFTYLKQYRISIAPLDFPATVLYKYAVVD